MAVAVPARTVMTPERAFVVDVLAVALTKSVAVPDVPLVGETVNQGWFELAVQDGWFVVNVASIEAAADNIDEPVGLKETSGVAATVPAWVTGNVAVAVPARTVMEPERAAVDVLAVALTVNAAPDAPLPDETVSQVWFGVAVQEDWFVVTFTLVELAAEPGDQEEGLKETLGAAAAWVTCSVAVAVPAFTVTEPERALVDVLAVALTVNAAPDAPLPDETVSQVVFEVAVQEDWFVVTVTLVELAAEPGDQEEGLKETLGVAEPPACQTLSVAIALPAFTVMAPARSVVDVLAVTLAVNVFPDAPVVGETVNQDWSELADQDDWFVVTVTLVELAAELGPQPDGLKETVGITEAWVTFSVVVAVLARTVMEPERTLVDVFSVTLTVNVFPDVPLLGETVNQDWSEVAVQDEWFVVTVTLVELASKLGSQEYGRKETFGLAATWVTGSVALELPPRTVMEPERSAVDGLAVTRSVSVAFPEPLLGETVNQGTFELAVQDDCFVVSATLVESFHAPANQ